MILIFMMIFPISNFLIFQVERMKKMVKGCIYRHIITPSTRLSRERPMALVAWGARLEFSVFYEQHAVDFIKTRALKGPENTLGGQYGFKLIEGAQIVSNEDDSNLCPQHQWKKYF